MDLTNTITVIVARPLAAPRRVADGLVTTAGGGEMLIGRPLIGVNDRIVAGMSHNQRFQCGAIRVFAEALPDVATAAPHDPHNRWAVTGPCCVAARLVGPPAWWAAWVSVLAAFLAGVLIQFVSFGHWVGQRCGRGKMRRHQPVYFVSSREQMGTIDALFVGQMQGWDTLSDAAEDLHNRGTAIAGLPPERASE